ncbi:MAG: hypothetical protein KDI79_25970, partial [Anaerolineae bacterium]|nr:hypothetical protein [Anaerolineae bacterium]
LIDGRPAQPSDVVFAIGGFTGTHSFTFTKENLGAGPHTVQIQWLVDAGGRASIGDRTLSLNYLQGQAPDLSKPFYGLQPVVGQRKVLVILWDPHRPDHPAPSKSAVENLIFGPRPSVRDYFLENSGGRFTIQNAGVLGWYPALHPWQLYWRSGPYDPANLTAGDRHRWVDVQGKYGAPGSIRYLDDDGFIGGHSHKWAEAVTTANAHFNYNQYDVDKNQLLTPDELTVLMVIPQNSPFGTQRPVVGRHLPTEQPLMVDGVRINSIVEAYIGSPPSLGVVAHELSHILLGTGDMYFSFFQPYAAGPYSLMDQSPHNPPHLDPFHKLRLGWLTPKLITSDGWYTIRSVETHHEVAILYDPIRGDDEYFIIENRWKGTSYDQFLPDQGLAIWHIMENPAIFDTLPTPPNVNGLQWNDPKWKGWSRRGIRMIRPIYGPPINWSLWDGANPQTGYNLLSVDPNPNHVTLRWADGSPSGFSIMSFPPASSQMTIYVKVN